MLAIIRRLQIAGIGAGLRGVALRLAEGEVFVAHVGIIALAVGGGVDGATEFGGAGEAGDRGWGGVFVVGWFKSQGQLIIVITITFLLSSVSSRSRFLTLPSGGQKKSR